MNRQILASKSGVLFLLLIAFALVSIWCTGDLMRKNDQAVILAGAYDLAHGQAQDWSAYYQYDKTYVVYWAVAAIFKAQQFVRCDADPIAVANMGLALAFWSALTIFTVRFRKILSPMVLLCFLTAPAVLLNTLYVNSSVLSSAFLLLSAIFLLQDGSRGGWLGALFFALAVGSRADVILLLPLLLWLTTPFSLVEDLLSDFSKGWKSVLRKQGCFSKPWKILGAGFFALLTGRVLGGAASVSVDLFFNSKMVLGYMVFGFGAAGLLFVIYSIFLAIKAVKGSGVLEKTYGLAGLFACLLPVLFFLPQLHAPRYFWRGCEVVLLLAASGHFCLRLNRRVVALVCVCAVLPLAVGVNASLLSRPKIVAGGSTLFPSGDGHYPMGGYFQFLLRLRNASETPVDHNQWVWRAVQQTIFEEKEQGEVPVLYTPMSGQLLLAASLQGKVARRASFEKLSGGRFYSDSRSLMRTDPKSKNDSIRGVLALPAQFVSPVEKGIGVLQFGVGDDRWGRQTQMLNQLFGGDEYRIVSLRENPSPGRGAYLFSEKACTGLQEHEPTGWFYSVSRTGDVSTEVLQAVSVFPSWMSLRTFKNP